MLNIQWTIFQHFQSELQHSVRIITYSQHHYTSIIITLPINIITLSVNMATLSFSSIITSDWIPSPSVNIIILLADYPALLGTLPLSLSVPSTLPPSDYPASLGTLPLSPSPLPPFYPPSLGLPGFAQNMYIVIAPNNSIPEIIFKNWWLGLVTLTFSPPPPLRGEGIQKI